MTHDNLRTVTSQDPHQVSPIAGNGEIVTAFGPSGYHDTPIRDGHLDTRQIAWSGRRLHGPTHPLIRFGRIQRSLTVDGAAIIDRDWSQTIDYDHGWIDSHLTHGNLHETTRSLVCLSENLLIFRSRFHNQGPTAIDLVLALSYAFPTTIDPNLHAPGPHQRVEGESEVAGAETIRLRVKTRSDGFSVYYHIGQHLGEVRLAGNPISVVATTTQGGSCTHRLTLAPGAEAEVWTWVAFCDRVHFTHFPDLTRIRTLVEDHARGWQAFWATSQVEYDDPQLTAFRQACLYTIRCNASPWSIPPGYFHIYWEGRTFHDELYPFLALLSAGHGELAQRIPQFRLTTLPQALATGGGLAAHYPWETTEAGLEGGPYGHWHDERFHIGQIAETAWRLFLYQRDDDDLRRFYPLLRGCAEMFVKDVLVRDAQGSLRTRLLTDFDENWGPLSNGIFTLAAAIRTLENAASAAERLQVDLRTRSAWQAMAKELRLAMPGAEIYTAADDAPAGYRHIAQVGPLHPFPVDSTSAKARATLTALHQDLKTSRNATVGGGVSNPQGSHWIWATALLATAYNQQGRGDEGFALLRQMLNSAGPFLCSNERWQEDRPQPIVLPWFTTSAGAAVFALHSTFVQVDETGTILLNGIGPNFGSARFTGLAASHGVTVSGEIRAGAVVRLSVNAPVAVSWSFAVPQRIATANGLAGHCDGNDLCHCEFDLPAGQTVLVGGDILDR
ncbi:hypothetical protein LBMAG53_09190 [Planctomycetota bacterium]|nr:hypothetical protein LBMAG53_09190 [Planctomycetota bacterium]